MFSCDDVDSEAYTQANAEAYTKANAKACKFIGGTQRDTEMIYLTHRHLFYMFRPLERAR